MRSYNTDIGRKISDKGWVDFQGSPEWRKPILDLEYNKTTFNVSDLKDLLKGFIDADMTYFFQGVKINPEVDEVLRQYKQYKGKITRIGGHDTSEHQMFVGHELVESYFSALNKELKKEGIPYISYSLATKDRDAYVPGILSWPTIFIMPAKGYQNLVDKVNLLNEHEDFKKENSSYYQTHNIIRNANIQPLLLDEDTSLAVTGDMVRRMSNLLFTYRGKYELRSHRDDNY